MVRFLTPSRSLTDFLHAQRGVKVVVTSYELLTVTFEVVNIYKRASVWYLSAVRRKRIAEIGRFDGFASITRK